MGQNGHQSGSEERNIFHEMASEGSLPVVVSSPMMTQLFEMCRTKNEQGMDTSQIERFIEEAIVASAEGKSLYAEVMFQIALDSLQ
jgi:hypothetical protein